MKNYILTAAIAALTINAAHADFEGAGGGVATSAASVSGTSVGSTQFGSGTQVSGAYAGNTTSAGATKTYSPTGVTVNANTLVSGYSGAYVNGTGTGTSSALAAEGGLATSEAAGGTGDADAHNVILTVTPHFSSAGGGGETAVDSTSAHGSISGAVNINGGYSYQNAGGLAWNDTTGYATVDATAEHHTADISLSTGVLSEGVTIASATGTNNAALGGSGAISYQDGDGVASAGGGVSNSEGHWAWALPPYVADTSGTGGVSIDSAADVNSFSAAGGFNNHDGANGAFTSAGHGTTGNFNNAILPNGFSQSGEVETMTHAVAVPVVDSITLQPIDHGSAIGSKNANANGGGTFGGQFDGNVITNP